MKTTRLALSLAAVALLLLCAVSAWAKGPANVKNTIHNLSSSAPVTSQYKSTESEICIFCHTPHGGRLEGPLWNRSVGVAPSGWTHYNSATISTYLQGLNVARTVNDESLLCMSCHDGSISTMHLINPSINGQPKQDGTLSTEVPIVPLFDGSPGAKIGGLRGNAGAFGNLSDDHPISFSYDQVLLSYPYNGGPKAGDLRTVAAAQGWLGEGVRFFGSDNRVECSSCHDPHVDYVTNVAYTPFLIRPNSSSNLCLSCHDK